MTLLYIENHENRIVSGQEWVQVLLIEQGYNITNELWLLYYENALQIRKVLIYGQGLRQVLLTGLLYEQCMLNYYANMLDFITMEKLIFFTQKFV